MKNNEARKLAMESCAQIEQRPTSLITYRSAGRVIVLGSEQALEKCDQLSGKIDLNRVTLNDKVKTIQATGHFGDYAIKLEDVFGNIDSFSADVILDLQDQPAIDRPLLPPGYFHVPEDRWDLQAVSEMLDDISGEFEKPKYFSYDPSICAHGVNGNTVCTNCIDACPAEAIQSIGERIEVDPFLCQGGGACATVCPSGAITYSYPDIRDQGNRIRSLMQKYIEQGGSNPVLVFHAQDCSIETLLEANQNWLALAVEELASVGMELCLSALCYGATQVLLLGSDEIPEVSAKAINEQLEWLHATLTGLGLDPQCVQYCLADDLALPTNKAIEIDAAVFGLPNSKRNAMFQGLDYLATGLAVSPTITLPQSAPFGEAIIDVEKCTLCMACVGSCPGRALQDGSNREVPEIFFIESNCLQCGACVTTCPEGAIQLNAQIVLDREARNRSRRLNTDTPFACISCGKAFAPSSVIHKMQDKLKDHYMFDSARALDRLKMCEDCRVADIVQDPDALGGQFDPKNQFRH
ncbi:MAG: ferredoxin [Planctomycetota bacterium]|jgi:ferredoxin